MPPGNLSQLRRIFRPRARRRQRPSTRQRPRTRRGPDPGSRRGPSGTRRLARRADPRPARGPPRPAVHPLASSSAAPASASARPTPCSPCSTDAGYVTRDPSTLAYSLGPALVVAGRRRPRAAARHRRGRVRRSSAPSPRELGLETVVSARTVGRDHLRRPRRRPRPHGPQLREGERVPLVPPLGGVFMAWAPPDDVEAWLARGPGDDRRARPPVPRRPRGRPGPRLRGRRRLRHPAHLRRARLRPRRAAGPRPTCATTSGTSSPASPTTPTPLDSPRPRAHLRRRHGGRPRLRRGRHGGRRRHRHRVRRRAARPTRSCGPASWCATAPRW